MGTRSTRSEISMASAEMREEMSDLCDEMDNILKEANPTLALSAVCLLLSRLLMRVMGNKYEASLSFKDVGIPIIENNIESMDPTTFH